MEATPRPPLYSDLDYLGSAGGYIDEVFDVIGRGQLFEQFRRNEIEALCRFMHCFAAPRGAELLREGDEGGYMLIILSGEVDVKKKNVHGEFVAIATVHPGDTLGEMALIDGSPRFALCVTRQPTDFAVMTRADFNEVLIAHPRLANKLLIRLAQILVGRLRATGERLVAAK